MSWYTELYSLMDEPEKWSEGVEAYIESRSFQAMANSALPVMHFVEDDLKLPSRKIDRFLGIMSNTPQSSILRRFIDSRLSDEEREIVDKSMYCEMKWGALVWFYASQVGSSNMWRLFDRSVSMSRDDFIAGCFCCQDIFTLQRKSLYYWTLAADIVSWWWHISNPPTSVHEGWLWTLGIKGTWAFISRARGWDPRFSWTPLLLLGRILDFYTFVGRGWDRKAKQLIYEGTLDDTIDNRAPECSLTILSLMFLGTEIDNPLRDEYHWLNLETIHTFRLRRFFKKMALVVWHHIQHPFSDQSLDKRIFINKSDWAFLLGVDIYRNSMPSVSFLPPFEILDTAIRVISNMVYGSWSHQVHALVSDRVRLYGHHNIIGLVSSRQYHPLDSFTGVNSWLKVPHFSFPSFLGRSSLVGNLSRLILNRLNGIREFEWNINNHVHSLDRLPRGNNLILEHCYNYSEQPSMCEWNSGYNEDTAIPNLVDAQMEYSSSKSRAIMLQHMELRYLADLRRDSKLSLVSSVMSLNDRAYTSFLGLQLATRKLWRYDIGDAIKSVIWDFLSAFPFAPQPGLAPMSVFPKSYKEWNRMFDVYEQGPAENYYQNDIVRGKAIFNMLGGLRNEDVMDRILTKDQYFLNATNNDHPDIENQELQKRQEILLDRCEVEKDRLRFEDPDGQPWDEVDWAWYYRSKEKRVDKMRREIAELEWDKKHRLDSNSPHYLLSEASTKEERLAKINAKIKNIQQKLEREHTRIDEPLHKTLVHNPERLRAIQLGSPRAIFNSPISYRQINSESECNICRNSPTPPLYDFYYDKDKNWTMQDQIFFNTQRRYFQHFKYRPNSLSVSNKALRRWISPERSGVTLFERSKSKVWAIRKFLQERANSCPHKPMSFRGLDPRFLSFFYFEHLLPIDVSSAEISHRAPKNHTSMDYQTANPFDLWTHGSWETGDIVAIPKIFKPGVGAIENWWHVYLPGLRGVVFKWLESARLDAEKRCHNVELLEEVEWMNNRWLFKADLIPGDFQIDCNFQEIENRKRITKVLVSVTLLGLGWWYGMGNWAKENLTTAEVWGFLTLL